MGMLGVSVGRMLGVSVGRMKALNLKMETVILIGKCG
jgi:hypothetical protein